MDFLIAKSVESARARGDAMLSLSLSALADVDVASPDEPEDKSRTFLKNHLARFYDFEGLFRWKKKFAPEFEDRYLVYPDPLSLPRVVLALARAQSPGGLRSYLARAA
jgi:phosphatidylglycerol lysyltransferase